MKLSSSYIELSSSALKFNLNFLRSLLNEGVRFSSVVKGNAYGHGYEQMIPLLLENQVKHFSVFSADEAWKVKSITGDRADIMIMGMIDDSALEWAINQEIEVYVFDVERFKKITEIAKRLDKKARVHLELETGMNRTGLSQNQLKKVLEEYEFNSNWIQIEGLCTHLAGAESIANFYRIEKQRSKFKRLDNKLRKFLPDTAKRHVACSAALLKYPKSQLDMVRVGILQYGFFPSREVMVDFFVKQKIHEYPLQRVISWKSTIMDIKMVPKGEFIGYGTSYLANDPTKIALVPVGYSHGFARALSNSGRVLIRGRRLAVIGMVNMNMMTVDVSHVDGVERGDEVVLIGNQGNQEISVSSFSETTQQVNYELLTRLPGYIPRTIVP